MIHLWSCPDCGPPSYNNSYTRGGKECIYTAHIGTKLVRVPGKQAAEIAKQFHPESVAEIQRVQS